MELMGDLDRRVELYVLQRAAARPPWCRPVAHGWGRGGAARVREGQDGGTLPLHGG